MGRLLEKHEIVSIKKKPEYFGKCESHPSMDYQFFCEKCNNLLCIYCKISGSHSSGEYASHSITPIMEAYERAKLDSDAPDSFAEKYKGLLKNQLKKVDDSIKRITDNARSAENQLYQELEKALDVLHTLAQTKLNVLIADQIELRRRYEELQWAESFLKYQSEVLKPQEYLKAWFRYFLITRFKERRTEISSTPKLELTEAEADITIQGSITAVSNRLPKVAEVSMKVAAAQYRSLI